MARLEGTYEQVSRRLMNIDPRFDGMDRKIDLRFDALDKKIDAVREALDKKIDAVREALDKKIDALDAKIDQRFAWTVGVIVSTWVTTIASIYLHH
jgi:tetrahydromethanopterin S-methyltransferase subunit G